GDTELAKINQCLEMPPELRGTVKSACRGGHGRETVPKATALTVPLNGRQHGFSQVPITNSQSSPEYSGPEPGCPGVKREILLPARVVLLAAADFGPLWRAL